jgi:hypothetical protein
VRQVRLYLELPEGLRHHWLAAGADLAAVPGWQYIDHALCEWWPKDSNFRTAFSRVKEWARWEWRWCIGGLTKDTLRPYTRHYFANAWVVRSADLMDAALETIVDAATLPATFLLTPEEFALVVSNGGVVAGDSHSAFIQRLEGAVSMKGFTVPPMRNFRLREQVRAQEIASAGPDYIQTSALSVREKYAVWKTKPPEKLSPATVEQVRRRLANAPSLQARDDEDAEQTVRAAFQAASSRERIKDVYRKLSDRELAERVAKWFPLYNAEDPVEALMISALTDKLQKFSRAELICMTQMAEAWEWDATVASILKSMNKIDRLTR